MNINDVSNLIEKSIENGTNFFNHMDLLIVGENTAGKSLLLKKIITKLKTNNVYFIDDKNRSIPSDKANNSDSFERFTPLSIVNHRIKDNIFNKLDQFSDKDGSEIVLFELLKNNKKYISLFKEVLNIDLNISKNPFESTSDNIDDINEIIDKDNTYDSVTVNNVNLENISSGTQSKLRMLMEVNFAYENGIKTIIIDEFNTNLDFKSSYTFFKQLKNKYTDIRFIITSHNIYTVRGINNIDVIKIYKQYDELYENICEFFDSNDLDNLEIIDRKLFGYSDVKDKKDILISNCLKNLIVNGTISEDEKKYICSDEEFSIRQKIVCNYIKRLIKK